MRVKFILIERCTCAHPIRYMCYSQLGREAVLYRNSYMGCAPRRDIVGHVNRAGKVRGSSGCDRQQPQAGRSGSRSVLRPSHTPGCEMRPQRRPGGRIWGSGRDGIVSHVNRADKVRGSSEVRPPTAPDLPLRLPPPSSIRYTTRVRYATATPVRYATATPRRDLYGVRTETGLGGPR